MGTLHVAEIPCLLGGTSTTNLAIGTGAKTFALVAGSPVPLKGMTQRVEKSDDPTKYVEGIVTAAAAASVTIEVTDTGGAGSVSSWTFSDGLLRFSSVPYLHPSAEGPYEPFIEQAAVYRSEISLSGARGQSSYGAMVVSNPDGRFDDLVRYGYGRAARFLLGDDTDAPGDLSRYLTAQVDDVFGDFATLTFQLVGREAELDVLVQAARFEGTNSGASGIEGLPDDVQAKVKPRTLGSAENATPVLVNATKRIHAVNFDRDGNTLAVAAIPVVRDNEDDLQFGSDRANLAALQAATIADGDYDTCLAAGLIRIGGTTFRGITCDVEQGVLSAGDRTVAAIVEQLVEEILDPADVSAADLTALDAASSAEVGIYLAEERTVAEVLDDLMTAVGGRWWFDADGVFRVARLALPSGTPVYTFKRVNTSIDVLMADEGDVLEIAGGPFDGESDAGRAVRRVTLGYRRNFTPRETGDIKGTTADDRAAFARLEYRTVTAPTDAADEAAVLAKHPNAIELSVDTLLTVIGDAEDEADRLFAMFSERRDLIRLTVKFGADVAGAVGIGSVVALDLDRFGYSGGKLFRVLGMSYDAATLTAELLIWGGVAP